MRDLSPGELRELREWVTKRRDKTFSNPLRKEYTQILIHVNRALLMQLRSHDQQSLRAACGTPLIYQITNGFSLYDLTYSKLLPVQI